MRPASWFGVSASFAAAAICSVFGPLRRSVLTRAKITLQVRHAFQFGGECIFVPLGFRATECGRHLLAAIFDHPLCNHLPTLFRQLDLPDRVDSEFFESRHFSSP